MKPVLLATDGSPTSERATETAIELAKLLDTELIVLSVWSIPYTAAGLAPAPINGDLMRTNEEEASKLVADTASRAEEEGVETRRVVLRGLPVEEICLAAETYEPQFLVLGAHGWGALKRAVFGSVSTGVLHRATCPVVVVRADPVQVKTAVSERRSVRTA